MIRLYLLTLLICAWSNLHADEERTLIASFRNTSGTVLQIKCVSPTKRILNVIREFDKAGFILDSFSSIDDKGGYEPTQYTYRFTISCKGVRKDGTIFTERTGGFAKSLSDSLVKAKEAFDNLKKEFVEGEQLELQKMTFFNEPATQE